MSRQARGAAPWAGGGSGTTGPVDAMDLLRTLLDPDRLAVVGVITRAPRTTAQIAQETGVRERDVVRTLGPLVQAGYVRRQGREGEPDAYLLDAVAWRAVAQDLPQAAPVHPRIGFGMTDDERDVLARFFTGERLELRRALVDEGFLDREPGVTEAGRSTVTYWRAGGRIA